MITPTVSLPTTPDNFVPVNRFAVNGSTGGDEIVDSSQPASEQQKQTNAQGLTPEEQERVEQLKKRDREVRRHEQAHLRAAGSLAEGGAQFEFTRGPDGKLYAVSGSVSIDTSKEGDPEENLEKGQRIVRAAMAPADPSAEDLQVAAKGRRIQMEARQKLRQQQNKELLNGASPDGNDSSSQNNIVEQANEIYDALSGNTQNTQPTTPVAVA